MCSLTGEHIYLRALEPEDLSFLYQLENTEYLWQLSDTLAPFSKYALKQFIKNATLDIYTTKQMRLVIACKQTHRTLGCIDLFAFEPKHKRAAVGIVVADPKDRNKGIALEALTLLTHYAFNILDMHQLHASITTDNIASKALFLKAGYKLYGTAKDWHLQKDGFIDVLFFQKINNKIKTE